MSKKRKKSPGGTAASLVIEALKKIGRASCRERV